MSFRPRTWSEEEFKELVKNRDRNHIDTVQGGVDRDTRTRGMGTHAPQGTQKPRAGAIPAPAPFRSNTEAGYASYLHVQMLGGDIQLYRYEPFRLHLAERTTLTPDFLVVMKDGSLQIHEVKGWAREDAMVKLKIAARLYPWWKFVLVKRVKGQWDCRELPV
jgi:hypothetical protein